MRCVQHSTKERGVVNLADGCVADREKAKGVWMNGINLETYHWLSSKLDRKKPREFE
jgi:hypothetical protein